MAGLGVLDDAVLELEPGLNVLTGETGAGKTMITVGLALALGARADSGMVRAGRRALAVEARFRLRVTSHEELKLLAQDEDEDLPAEGEEQEVVLARTVGAEGRGSARLNGRLVPVASLARVGGTMVEIHGQNQATRLLSPPAQTAFVDRFAGREHLETLDRYRAAHRDLRRAVSELERIESAGREREREIDLLRYQIREIEAARVAPGEMAGLAEEESRLAHAERILSLAGAAEQVVGEDGGAVDRLREATAGAQAIAGLDPSAAALVARMQSATAEAADVLDELRAYRLSIEVDPGRLAAVQERLRSLKGLERKYGDGEEGILGYQDQASARLDALEGQDANVEGLRDRVAELSGEVGAMAASLSEGRAHAAPRLAQALRLEVRALGMPGADVSVSLEPMAEPGPDGAERIELLFSGGPGQPSLPLGRAASGGELSRVMLGCRSVLADLDDVPTLVFDEVDAGIGGRTALAVAERLAQVATGRQVLVVTHLAQIAARADRHLFVEKEGGTATVRPLEGEERVEELARMLSGQTGKASLAHARELIDAGAGRAS